MRPVYGRPRYGLTIRDLEPDEAVRRDDLRDRPVRGPPPRHRLRLRARRGRAPGPLRRRARRAPRRDAGPGLRAPAARRDGRRRRARAGRRASRAPAAASSSRGDTAPTDAVVVAAHRADVLVHEATFAHEDADRAAATLHSTARQAAQVAADAEVRLLALTHLSSRYSGGEIRDEAREVFADTEVPRDFDTIEIPLPERGEPELVRWDGGAQARRGSPRRRSSRRPDAVRRPAAGVAASARSVLIFPSSCVWQVARCSVVVMTTGVGPIKFTGNARIVSAALVGVVLLAAGGWAAARQIKSPAQIAADTAAPSRIADQRAGRAPRAGDRGHRARDGALRQAAGDRAAGVRPEERRADRVARAARRQPAARRRGRADRLRPAGLRAARRDADAPRPRAGRQRRGRAPARARAGAPGPRAGRGRRRATTARPRPPSPQLYRSHDAAPFGLTESQTERLSTAASAVATATDHLLQTRVALRGADAPTSTRRGSTRPPSPRRSRPPARRSTPRARGSPRRATS